MNFKTIADSLETGNLHGDTIVAYRNFCAAWLARFNTEYGELVAKSALWQTAQREKYKSMAECERAWQATDDGQREISLKYQIKSIEHISDGLLTNHLHLQREMKDAGAL